MITKRGLITNIILILLDIGGITLSILFHKYVLALIIVVLLIGYFSVTSLATKYYEDQVAQLNKETKEFQETLQAENNNDIVYLNSKEYRKFLKEGKLYRGTDKEPLILGDKENDHTENFK